ncbi:hypothetical protein C3B55_00611 [Candidatus Pseudomonas adelgestsugas]|uniref:Uncharacterized protein n=1 Tax=Candidatus Pseudomonas adelgestsugas TaxID=1302376 RepID=A0ABX5R8G7_9PSED|nr:hypothetical protein C3B55_00611 [Candidatus Pseudomonas adelgestsugas]
MIKIATRLHLLDLPLISSVDILLYPISNNGVIGLLLKLSMPYKVCIITLVRVVNFNFRSVHR